VSLDEVQDEINNTGQYWLDAPNQQPLRPNLKISQVWPEPSVRLHVFVGLPVGAQGSSTLVRGVCFLRLFALAQDI